MVDPAIMGTVVLQGGIVAIVVVAQRRGNVPAVVNALLSLAASVLPWTAAIAMRFAVGARVTVDPVLPLWIAVAGVLHSYGMLGPYDEVWWWDNLTHAVSAALVAALVYAGLLVVAGQSTAPGVSAETVGGLTVAFTVALGVFWEAIELVAREVGERFDVEPVLVHYGWRDTALDVVFDAVGAVVVVLLDLRIFVPLADRFPRATSALVLGGAVVAVVGSLLLALGIGLVHSR